MSNVTAFVYRFYCYDPHQLGHALNYNSTLYLPQNVHVLRKDGTVNLLLLPGKLHRNDEFPLVWDVEVRHVFLHAPEHMRLQ